MPGRPPIHPFNPQQHPRGMAGRFAPKPAQLLAKHRQHAVVPKAKRKRTDTKESDVQQGFGARSRSTGPGFGGTLEAPPTPFRMVGD